MVQGAPHLPPHRPSPGHHPRSLTSLHPKIALQALGSGAGSSSDAPRLFFLKLHQEDVSIKRPSGSKM